MPSFFSWFRGNKQQDSAYNAENNDFSWTSHNRNTNDGVQRTMDLIKKIREDNGFKYYGDTVYRDQKEYLLELLEKNPKMLTYEFSSTTGKLVAIKIHSGMARIFQFREKNKIIVCKNTDGIKKFLTAYVRYLGCNDFIVATTLNVSTLCDDDQIRTVKKVQRYGPIFQDYNQYHGTYGGGSKSKSVRRYKTRHRSRRNVIVNASKRRHNKDKKTMKK